MLNAWLMYIAALQQLPSAREKMPEAIDQYAFAALVLGKAGVNMLPEVGLTCHPPHCPTRMMLRAPRDAYIGVSLS